jgi:hypothetical protein
MSGTDDQAGTDESGDGENSTTFSELRAQRDEAVKARKAAEAQLEEFASQATAAREASAQAIVDSLGLPGLKDDVLGWVEGDVTEEAVVAALKVRGIQPPGPADPAAVTDEDPTPASMSELSQAVENAATGNAVVDVNERLNAADGDEELWAVADEAGITRSYL